MKDNARRSALNLLTALPIGVAGLAFGSFSAAASGGGKSTAAGDATTLAKVAARQDEADAHRKITDVLYLYARGWDRLDEPLLRSCFWPDSRHQHGGFKGLSQDFIGHGFDVMSKVKGSSHIITNPLVRVRGERALSECYFLAHHRRMNKAGSDEEDYFIKGRYLDRFERRNGEWKIAYRRGLSDFERVVPRADQTLANAPPDQLSHRKPDDPLFSMIADFEAGR